MTRRRIPSLVGLFLVLAGCSASPPRRGPGLGPAPPLWPPAPAPAPVQSPTAAPTPAAPYRGLGVASVPPEVLARFAPPPLPPEQSRRIQAMLDVRAPGTGLVTSDGKRMFFSWSITGTQQIWRIDGPMRFAVQLTGGEDTTLLGGVTPDGRWLLVSRDRSGEENPGLYLLSPDGGPLRVVQHKPGVQTVLDYVGDDSRTLYYHANDISPSSYAVYRYDIETGKNELLLADSGLWSVADVRGTELLLQKSVGSNMNEYFAFDVNARQLEPLFGQGEREDYVASFGAEPGEIILLTPKLGEFRRLYRWERGQDKLEPVSPELGHDVSDFSIDRPRTRILYTVNEGGYTRAFALDARTKRPIRMPSLPAADHVWPAATSPSGRYTTFRVDTGRAPAQSYVCDWTTRSAVKWHEPSTPEIDTKAFARAVLESYPARDGTPIPMFVRRPAACEKPTEAPCPVIVEFHGGPEGQAIPGFSTTSQLFVDSGFVLVEPNVRGSDGYGKTWVHADDGAKRLAVLADIEDVGRHIRQAWAVQGKSPRIGVFGGSYGGYAALVGMTHFAGTYDAGVSLVGISSLLTFLENTAPYRRILRISEYGDPEKDRATLQWLSPIATLERLSAPLLLLQGATDPRVPVGEALQLHELAVRRGLASELIIYPDEGHGMRKRSNQVNALGHTLRFFEKQLK